MKFSTIDIETNGYSQFVISAYYAGAEVTFFNSIEKMMFFILENHDFKAPIYAHFGGIFDFIHIISWIENKQAGEIENIIGQGAKIIKFEWNINGKIKFEFRDFSAMFNKSLLKISESLNLNVKKGDFDHNKKKKYSDKILREYLSRDVVSLYQAIEKTVIRFGGNIKLTAASQSFSEYKKILKNENIKLPILDKKINDFCKLSFCGGRTEIFKPYYIGKNLNWYDVTSMYPHVMLKNFFPGPVLRYSTKISKTLGIYKCVVETPTELHIPVLPLRTETELSFPLGIFTGVWTNVELLKAIEKGYKVEVLEGYEFETRDYFHTYISYLWKRRQKAKEKGDKIDDEFCKLLMNALYGRFGFNNDRESLSFNNSHQDFKKLYEIKLENNEIIEVGNVPTNLDMYSNFAIASFVTSYARLELLSYLEMAGDNLYYCDTDSIVTTSVLPTSKHLGGLKLEKQLTRAVFLQPKSYYIEDIEGKSTQKAKGIPNKYLRLKYEDWSDALTGIPTKIKAKIGKGLYTLRAAMKKGKLLLERPSYYKNLITMYSKRELIKQKNGDITSNPVYYFEE